MEPLYVSIEIDPLFVASICFYPLFGASISLYPLIGASICVYPVLGANGLVLCLKPVFFFEVLGTMMYHYTILYLMKMKTPLGKVNQI